MNSGVDVFAELCEVDASDVRSGGELLADFVRYAETSGDCWKCEHRPDHFTSSGLVANEDASRVLLGLHAKVGRWLQFGGHIEGGDATLLAAARRETEEESGLTALTVASPQPIALDAHAAPCGRGAQRHLDVQYVFVADERSLMSPSDESLAVSWFDASALPADTDASVRRLVQAAVDQLRSLRR